MTPPARTPRTIEEVAVIIASLLTADELGRMAPVRTAGEVVS